MIKIKSIGFPAILLTAAAISSALMADTVTLSQGPYSYYVGGEFTAVTGQNGTFQTFCVQTSVDFTPYNFGNTTPYNYTVSLNSIGAPDAFPLSEGAAYLFSQFAQGTLSGYDYNLGNDPTDAAARQADAGELQSALWWLQGNQTFGGYPSGTIGNTYYGDALTHLGANVDAPATLATDFGVEIMNLTDGNGNPAQNQLIYLGGGGGHQNAPDGGATLALLALSVAGLAVVRRLGSGQRAL
jgi:hypothetical protein